MLTAKQTINCLKTKSTWVRIETLKISKVTQDVRLASSLSPVEILVTLYYGGIIKYNSQKPLWDGRDRFIISKGHGSISFYPILADLGFFDKKELARVCQEQSLLGGIPDCNIPGYETINGSLGHGLGVACGIAMALEQKRKLENVYVLLGDGELYEGSVWEAIMFAGEHKLNNLTAIIDSNGASMLDFCKNIINLEPIEEKFRAFGWEARIVDGHNVNEIYHSLMRLKSNSKINKPKVLIANTIKGKGVSRLEADPLSHVKNLSWDEINILINSKK